MASYNHDRPYVDTGKWPHHAPGCVLGRNHKNYCRTKTGVTVITDQQMADMRNKNA